MWCVHACEVCVCGVCMHVRYVCMWCVHACEVCVYVVCACM